MDSSRRAFIASLLLGGLALNEGLPRRAWGKDASMAYLSAQAKHSISGYPFTLASGVPRPAWSVLPGETVHFALSASKHAKRKLTLQAANGHVVHDFGAIKFGEQDFFTDSPWLDGAGYAPTVHWKIPLQTRSGVYFLNGLPDLFVIVRQPLQGTSVKPVANALPTAVLIPTNTINSYSTSEGRSGYAHPHRVPQLNFMRPFNASVAQNWIGTLAWLNAEPLLNKSRHLADSDLDDPRALHGVRLLIVIGHSEYWTREARQVFDAFVSRGGHVIVASGNTMWWQVRYANSGRQMVCYKNYDQKFGKDPVTDPLLETQNWLSARLKYSIVDSIGGDFRYGGYGSRRTGLKVEGKGLRVFDPRHPLFAGQGLDRCTSLDFGGVGEYDGAPIAGLDARGLPVAAATPSGSRLQIVAYEWTRHSGATLATAHLYQPQANGGVIFHLGAAEATNGLTSGCQVMRRAALRFARRALHGQSAFMDVAAAKVEHVLHSPWPQPLPIMAGRCAPPGRMG